MRKKGVSPVIATVLLIAIVIVLAMIIFLWARGFVSEKAQKFGRAVELSCEDTNFEAEIYFESNAGVSTGPFLDVINRGNVPLYGFVVKKLEAGSVEISQEVLENTIAVGRSVSINLNSNAVSQGDEVLIVPMVLGEIETGKVAHTCPDYTGFGTSVVGY